VIVKRLSLIWGLLGFVIGTGCAFSEVQRPGGQDVEHDILLQIQRCLLNSAFEDYYAGSRPFIDVGDSSIVLGTPPQWRNIIVDLEGPVIDKKSLVYIRQHLDRFMPFLYMALDCPYETIKARAVQILYEVALDRLADWLCKNFTGIEGEWLPEKFPNLANYVAFRLVVGPLLGPCKDLKQKSKRLISALTASGNEIPDWFLEWFLHNGLLDWIEDVNLRLRFLERHLTRKCTDLKKYMQDEGIYFMQTVPWKDTRASGVHALAFWQCGRAALPVLRRLLKHESPDVRATNTPSN